MCEAGIVEVRSPSAAIAPCSPSSGFGSSIAEGPVFVLVSILNPRLTFALLLIAGILGANHRPKSAQDVEIDAAFSDTFIRDLGYSEIEITVGPDGVEAPTTLASGYYLVTFAAAAPYIGDLGPRLGG